MSMSSVQGPTFSGFKAVDRIYLPSDSGLKEDASLAQSGYELSPWIQVELVINYFVEGVKIWDRSEHHQRGE